MNEEDVIEQLAKLIDKISLDQIGMRKKIEEEICRYNKFRSGVLGKEKDVTEKQKSIDIKNYAKYILKEGSIIEKREVMACLQNKIVLKNKEIYLS